MHVLQGSSYNVSLSTDYRLSVQIIHIIHVFTRINTLECRNCHDVGLCLGPWHSLNLDIN